MILKIRINITVKNIVVIIASRANLKDKEFQFIFIVESPKYKERNVR